MKALRQLKEGVASLGYWWLKDYPPVMLERARARAAICLSCPLNQPATAFEAPKRSVVLAIKLALEAKHEMKLEMPCEPLLGLCEACGCDLRLKVWQPVESIFYDGRPDYFEDLHPKCWARSEAPEVKL